MRRAIGTAWKILALSAILPLLTATVARGSTTAAQWNMDEPTGTTMNDSSGNNNNGTTYNVTMGLAGFTVGTGAYGFNGSSSQVIVPNSASLNPGSSNFAIIIHVKMTVRPGTGDFDYDVVRKGNSYKIEIFPHNGVAQAQCVFKGVLTGTVMKANLHAGPDLVDGNWHTITCQKTASTLVLVVDGGTYTKSVTLGSISNGKSLYLGSKPDNTDFFNGVLDDVTITSG